MKIVRSDCHGFAWPAWDFRDRARERNRQGADTQHYPGSRLSRAAPGVLQGAGVVDLTDILGQRVGDYYIAVIRSWTMSDLRKKWRRRIRLCVGANPYIGSRRVFDDRQALARRPGRDLST